MCILVAWRIALRALVGTQAWRLVLDDWSEGQVKALRKIQGFAKDYFWCRFLFWNVASSVERFLVKGTVAQTGAHVQSCKKLWVSSFPGVLYQNEHPFHLQVRLRLGKLPSDLLTMLVRVLPLEVLELKVDASVYFLLYFPVRMRPSTATISITYITLERRALWNPT